MNYPGISRVVRGLRPRFGKPKYRYSPNAQNTRERVRRLRQASHGVLPASQFLTRVDYDLAKERYLNLVLKLLSQEHSGASAQA